MTAREECTCIKLPVGGRLPMDDCPVHPPDVAERRANPADLIHEDYDEDVA